MLSTENSIQQSAVAPLLWDIFSERVYKLEQAMLKASDYETFTKNKARLEEVKLLRSRLGREEK